MWSSITTGILTIAGTLLGVWITRRGNERDLKIRLEHEVKQKNEALLRERAEEVCILLDNWLKTLSIHSMSLSMVMQGKLHYDQHHDLVSKDPGSKNVDFSRMEMIIDFYLPHVRSSFDAIIEARTEINKLARQHKQEYEQGNVPGVEFLRPYIQAIQLVEQRGRELRGEIVTWQNKNLQPTGFAGS